MEQSNHMERISSKKRKTRNEKAGIRQEFCSEQKTNVGDRDNKKGEADKEREEMRYCEC